MEPQSSFSPPPYYPGYTPQPSWWSRNWKWLVPVGCFGLIAVVLLFFGFFATIVFGIFGMIKSSGAYEQAVARAKSSLEVRQALGEPVEEGWFLTGNVRVNGSSGTADLEIPLSGPKDEGRLRVRAIKSDNRWTFRVLRLDVKGSGERIDLLGSGTI